MEHEKKTNERIYVRQRELLRELLEQLVPQVITAKKPADRLLAEHFRQHREFGSRDRRFLSESFFSFFRWRGWTSKFEILMAAAVSRLLDGAEIHPALAPAVKSEWTPLAGKTLEQKRDTLKQWFPESEIKLSDLVPDGFEKSVNIPASEKIRFYESLQQRPPTWLRLRSEKFKDTLNAAGISFTEHPLMRRAVAVDGGAPLASLGATGQYEIQDITSQAVVEIAAPESGSEWWDACSGSGGKALQLADAAGAGAKILATDIRENALAECKKRARTDGISTIRTQLHNLAGDPPFTKQFAGVLVDAPCSGWGTWNRNPDARWRSDLRDPAQKRNLQIRMLNNAAQSVEQGGILIYAVCTFTREETNGVVEKFLAEHSNFKLQPFTNPLTGAPADGTLQLWPHETSGDGMFIARFKKN